MTLDDPHNTPTQPPLEPVGAEFVPVAGAENGVGIVTYYAEPPQEPRHDAALTAALARFADMEGDVAPLASRPTGKPLEWEADMDRYIEGLFAARSRPLKALGPCLALALLPAVAHAADFTPLAGIPWGAIILALGGAVAVWRVGVWLFRLGIGRGSQALAATGFMAKHPGLREIELDVAAALDRIVLHLDEVERPLLADGPLDAAKAKQMADMAIAELKLAAKVEGLPLLKRGLELGGAWLYGMVAEAVDRKNVSRDVKVLNIQAPEAIAKFHSLPLATQVAMVKAAA